MRKNSFIYEENAKIGRVMIVEGENGSTEIHKVKEDEKVLFTLDSPWWDLDGIGKEIEKNEDEIAKAVNTHIINGIYGIIDSFVKEYAKLDDVSKKEIRVIFDKRIVW